MRQPSEKLLPISAHPLAIAEARCFANLARTLAANVAVDAHPGELLAYLVNAGLAMELYMKAIMIAGRGGRVTQGHNLQILYSQFPDFLKNDMEAGFTAIRAGRDFEIKMIALTIRDVQPKPPQTETPMPDYKSFAGSISTASNAFVQARYFFEEVKSDDWAIFSYAPQALDWAMLALDGTYERFVAGAFVAQEHVV